jgi:hypothetical protein
MFPGNGSVVANASGTGVHETLGYWGHGGGGGLTARAARCCWISLETVGMRIGFADALPTKIRAATATAPDAADRRPILNTGFSR